MTACDAMMVAKVARIDQRQAEPVGCQHEERAGDRLWPRDQQRALPEIVEHQCREDEIDPADLDRRPPEMSHVGVERLCTRDGQHHRSERQERAQDVRAEKSHGIERVEREEDGRITRDADRPQHRQGPEVDAHHRPEQRPHRSGAEALDREQPDQDRHRDRNDQRLQAGMHNGEPLRRREHGDRRRDHAVAVEERAGEHAEHDEPGREARAGQLAGDQREQGKATTLAAVVRPHQDRHVFKRDDDHHRPEDQRQHTIDVGPVDRQRVMPGKRLPKRIERRRADVAEHDTDRAQRQLEQARLGVMPLLRRSGIGSGVQIGRSGHGGYFMFEGVGVAR